MRAETELLLSLIRPTMDEAVRQHRDDLLRAPIDWTWITAIAEFHGVVPQLYRGLSSVDPSRPPAGLLDRLHTTVRAIAERNLLLTAELLHVLQTLEATGIRALPLKGPVLAQAVYGNLALRQFSDLDILVCDDDYPHAASVIRDRGYELVSDYGFEVGLLDATRDIHIDLHRSLLHEHFPLELDFEYLWNRTQLTRLGGVAVPGMCLEDTLMLLCVQVAKEGWGGQSGLSKICDIRELVDRSDSLDWGRLHAEVERLGIRTMFFLGLELAQTLLGAHPPADVVRAMSRARSVRSVGARIANRLFEVRELTAARFSQQARAHFRLRERLADRLYPYYSRYIAPIVHPTANDRAALRVPSRYAWVHFLVRPVRLIRRYTRGEFGVNPFASLLDW